MKFIQDQKDIYSSIETHSDYVEFKLRYKSEKLEAYIPYEEISNDTIVQAKNSFWVQYYFAALFTLIILIALAVYNPAALSLILFSAGLLYKGISEQKKNKYDLIILPCNKYNIIMINCSLAYFRT